MELILQFLRAAFSRTEKTWLPEAAPHMVRAVWEECKNLGFKPTNYGTHRWLERDPTVERIDFAKIGLGNSFECAIEDLPKVSRAHYEQAGLCFASGFPTEIELDVFQSALSLIASVPSLHTTVALYLRSIHVLKAPATDYDISHSDPCVPFSIFTSVPLVRRNDRLRLAESIIHECMHLQLTLAERTMPFASSPEIRLFSPWRQDIRPITGLLHGLYVFTVVHEFYNLLCINRTLSKEESIFVHRRRCQIIEEVDQIDFLESADGLTDDGRRLVRFLIRRFEM